MVIHKSVRPRDHYIDPSWCMALRRKYGEDQLGRLSGALVEIFHRRCRMRWTDVTCAACLRKRKRRPVRWAYR